MSTRARARRWLTVGVAGCAAAAGAATLELYPTIESAGVIVTLAAGEDPNGDATAAVEYRTGSAGFTAAFPPARVRQSQLVGSLFFLAPATSYEVRVTLTDPDGPPLDGIVLQGVVTTRAEPVVPPPSGDTWQVAPGGSGTLCSATAPCSLQQGISSAHAGDAVVLHTGTYFVGEIDLPRSGTAGAPIVIRAVDGESPVLDGSLHGTLSWAPVGGGVFLSTTGVSDTHLVVAGGERLYPYASYADLQGLVWGISGFWADGAEVYVHLVGGGAPDPATTLVSRYNRAFFVDQDHIIFAGLTFRYYGRGSYAKAVYLSDASDVLITGCRFETCDLGIGIKYGSHRTVVDSCEFSDTIFDWPWDAVKAGSGLETGGVRMYDPMTGRGTVIRRNTFHDDFDGFGVCPAGDTGTTVEVDVADNLGYELGDDGFETDGHCSNVRMWGNTFHDVLVGISLAPAGVGPAYALRNLIYRTGVGVNSYSGMPFKLNSGDGPSGPIYLVHNTADAALADNDGCEIRSPGSWPLLWSRNNIWAGTRYALSNANPSQPVDLDWDDLWTSDPSELVWWDGLPDRHLETLAELRTATGQELHGMNLEPEFVAPESGDYRLVVGAGLVDAGQPIPGVNNGFAGAAPDLGAFELPTTLFADGFESGDADAWSSAVGGGVTRAGVALR